MRELRPGARLTHYKGMPYQFLFYAVHSESLEEVAVYECLYENPRGTLWVRPRGMFDEALPGSQPARARFAEVTDREGQPLRMEGCSAAQAQGLAARQNIRCWSLLDRWDDASTDERAEALEAAHAALAMTRQRGNAGDVARAHWLVALVMLRLGIPGLAAAHAAMHAAFAQDQSAGGLATAVDRALSLELQARLASVAGQPSDVVEDLKDQAVEAMENLADESARERCLAFFEEPPW